MAASGLLITQDYPTLYRWSLSTTFAPAHRQIRRQKNICSASLMSVRGTFETQNGLKWEIVPAFVAMEDYFGKER